MNTELLRVLEEAKMEIPTAKSSDELSNFYNKYVGKTGALTSIMKIMKDLSNEERREFGKEVNDAKQTINTLLKEIGEKLEKERIEAELKATKAIDLTIPTTEKSGSLHPITVIEHKIIEVFRSMGFSVEDGNEIETEYNNFEAVNIPKNHPARDMQDTFYLSNGQLLKTHTSAAQNRIMRKYGAPLKAIFPGRCFRNEELDASHENTFFQLEGMMIDKNVNISNLIYFMKEMLRNVFGKDVEVRLRPGFFPFVEPGFELDCSCPYCGGKGCKVCKNGGWIELCPCGMIHPNVLKMGGIDPEEYQGFAFGLGLTRLAMMTYEVNDIRVLNSGNIKALSQTKLN